MGGDGVGDEWTASAEPQPVHPAARPPVRVHDRSHRGRHGLCTGRPSGATAEGRQQPGSPLSSGGDAQATMRHVQKRGPQCRLNRNSVRPQGGRVHRERADSSSSALHGGQGHVRSEPARRRTRADGCARCVTEPLRALYTDHASGK